MEWKSSGNFALIIGTCKRETQVIHQSKAIQFSTRFHVLHNKENKFEDWNVLPPASRNGTKFHGVITMIIVISTLIDLGIPHLAKVNCP